MLNARLADKFLKDELRHETVKYHNGVGFKPQDAKKGLWIGKVVFGQWVLDRKADSLR